MTEYDLEAARIEAMHTGDWTHYEHLRREAEKEGAPRMTHHTTPT